ncbi:hypothetical protein GPECTOR_12g416 [Gonium pectorale]|uniref:S1 motif domain-containing protein n=1 Tax=Gonium pectorale TaxID=33097 RepID=A0A150GNN6_GONPE|nr:hypothetical protein GPECTOR_12g416 [Gonium pectorale]|eukprot:KXZ51453.1 hypothetical protein GPECTOR_12g416 [Gonium pectorale]
MRGYRSRLHAPSSQSIAALDAQLYRDEPDAPSRQRAAAALDDAVARHTVRMRQLTPGQLDTLRLLSRSNVGTTYLRGQSILAKVLSVDSVRIVVDTGYHGLAEVPRCDVSVTHIHTPDGTAPPSRSSTNDVRPGDVLRLRVDATYTPYGDMQLSAVQEDVAQRRRAIWAELRGRMEARLPVKGRVLNECSGGYAVGVAGFTALLPVALAATATVRMVGVPQDFIIMSMDEERHIMTLRDPSLDVAKGAGGGRYQQRGGGSLLDGWR